MVIRIKREEIGQEVRTVKSNVPRKLPMSVFQRKLCALLDDETLLKDLECLDDDSRSWWRRKKEAIEAIASSSDRVNLKLQNKDEDKTRVKHPISGQEQTITAKKIAIALPDRIKAETDPKTVFWWCWRFVPELRQGQCNDGKWEVPDALLQAKHAILPDCPVHSYRATVSALAGAIDFDEEGKVTRYPYILLFTFSPVQEFIKASRKFLDFWAGSYLLHYLSAKLCWYIAEKYGADAVITPSLWSQEIIDALLFKNYLKFAAYCQDEEENQERGFCPLYPIAERFGDRSNSLATAGFPNTIAVLVGGKEEATKLGEGLSEKLREEWRSLANNVREGIKDHPIPEIKSGIRDRVMAFLDDSKNQKKIAEILQEFKDQGGHDEQNQRDIESWKNKCCWEWRRLWQAQIDHTWQPYWTAVPLGDVKSPLDIKEGDRYKELPDGNLIKTQEDVAVGDRYDFDETWMKRQEEIAKTRAKTPPPTEAEKIIYATLNDGTWWGSIQARCANAMQGLKNARTWAIPISPGVRSTLSGQLSALHPQLFYGTKRDRDRNTRDFREGYGLSMESMRLFWRIMAEAHPGLFDGSEMLNALELTKRMSWVYGGVAESLGIDLSGLQNDPDYEQFIRFPNLSSIAAAKFAYLDWQKSQDRQLSLYWRTLNAAIEKEFGNNSEESDRFAARTRGRPFRVPKTDNKINPDDLKGRNYNGVMFSSKWLADDLNLDREKCDRLRPLVSKAHKIAGFSDASPSDWWVIVLGDGDGMGQYVSGSKLHPYEEYLTETNPENLIDRDRFSQDPQKRQDFITAFQEGKNSLLKTRKRMGPATHVGLNLALLDFSNRLVPFITEKRFCGRVVYSGGDDVMAVLPLEDLPDYLLSLRAAWCGDKKDPYEPQKGDPDLKFEESGGYWKPIAESDNFEGLPNRPLFTMGKGATMSFGIVIAHKSVPLPAALDALWEAESDRAKKMPGSPKEIESDEPKYKPKNGLCFKVLYGSGNCLEALMKGELFADWRKWMKIEATQETEDLDKQYQALSSLLYRLAEELPKHAAFTKSDYLIAEAAKVIIDRRDEKDKVKGNTELLVQWLRDWEDWARSHFFEWKEKYDEDPNTPDLLGFNPNLRGLANLLRFSAFWLDKMQQREKWHEQKPQEAASSQ
ncbi:MAG: type III-B CRISPR-associated protein Cas10/Cmr2 [Cyanobacteria bacterium P01_E01_bin.42]